MATVKAVLRPYKNASGEQAIYIRVSHKGKTKYSSVGITVKPQYWNSKKGQIRENDYYDANSINKVINDKLKSVRDELYSIKARGDIVTTEKILNSVFSVSNNDFFSFADQFVKRKFSINVRTGRRYKSILKKLREYTEGELLFTEITVEWINRYADWLSTKKGNQYSTVHGNLRAIRAILNEAIIEDRFPFEKNPFLKLKMQRPKTSKVKLNIEELNCLKALHTFSSELQQIARDAFLFSFYTCGMRFTDLCLLTWENVEGNYLKYYVSKTKEYLSVELVPEAKEILGKYRNENVETIFPLLDDLDHTLPAGKQVSRIGSVNAKVNSALKIVAKNSGINKNLSFHTARHSYANIANNLGMPISVIQSTLNHKSSKTTEVYLNSLENEVVNENVRSFFEAVRNG